MVQITSAEITLAAFLLTSLGALLGGAVAYGALRKTVQQLEALVVALTKDVTTLREQVASIKEAQAEQRGRDQARAEHEETARHRAQ